MKILAVDIGNTSAHYGIVSGENVTRTGHFPSKQFHDGPCSLFTEAVAPLFEEADGIAFCSVVPSINASFKASLGTHRPPVFQLTHTTCKGLALVYPKPAEIGQDRLANAIAAQAFYGMPAIVIDMGTAITFDILSSAGYEGGIIAPGLAMMTRYLHEQTALLPELSPEDLVGVDGMIGKSTVHAMKLGVAVGFSGMVDALLTKVIAELAKRGEPSPTVLSTGGSVANLTQDWVRKTRFVENLTLIGLGASMKRFSEFSMK